jgi:hypothetical protein
MSSGRKYLSLILLLPVLTILVHNAIPHHHHVSPVEVCCDNQLHGSDPSHLLCNSNQTSAGHHDACSFNPEFTTELSKSLIANVPDDFSHITCPLRWIEVDYVVSIVDDALCRAGSSPSLLRGPPVA